MIMHNHDECNKDTPGKYFFFPVDIHDDLRM